jgi:hypothetical protein
MAYVVTVTARDGTNTASCQLGVTAHDPAGANGFAGTATTCVAAASTPVAGSGGCPSGAAVLNQSNYNTALSTAFGSNKRVLFKCGDTFTGADATLTGTKWSVGAYGSCPGTQTGRPIFHSPSNSSGALLVASSSIDGRISDIDFEGAGSGKSAVGETGTYARIASQITLYNLYSNGMSSNYSSSQGQQYGIVESVTTGMRNGINTYLNYGGNNPSQWSGNPNGNNLDYQALLGNQLNGQGATSGPGIENIRISGGRLMVIENNVSENANDVGAVLKLHEGNPVSNQALWVGIYAELIEISDNWFGGTSGSQGIEIAPQNGGYDERIRNIVFERNIVSTGPNGAGGKVLVDGSNITLRDNVFYTASGISPVPYYPIDVAQRGNCNGNCPTSTLPQYVEVYNNTCYRSQNCVGFDGLFYFAPPQNSYAKNNLYYNTTNSYATVVDKGTGNTVSNNTATPTNNPSFTNGSGSFSLISDFKPTANYSGGKSVPVWHDATSLLWSSTWDLGAVHH